MNDDGLPPAWSNWQVRSGLSLENVSGRDTLMTFGAGCADRMVTRMIQGGFTPSQYGVLPLVEYDNSLIIDEDGKGWIPGNPSAVFDIGGPAMTPAARVFPMSDCGTSLGTVAVAAMDGTIHAFNVMDWTECPSWPVMLDTLVTFPVPAQSPDGTYIIAAENEGQIHLLGTDGLDVGTPVSPPSGYRVKGNLVIEKNTVEKIVWSLEDMAHAGNGWAAVALGRRGLWLVDLSDPAAPLGRGVPLAGFEGSMTVVAAAGDRVYAVDQWNDGIIDGFRLTIHDISTPSSPVVLGSFSADGVVEDIAAGEDAVYLALTGARLLEIDATDPLQPGNRWFDDAFDGRERHPVRVEVCDDVVYFSQHHVTFEGATTVYAIEPSSLTESDSWSPWGLGPVYDIGCAGDALLLASQYSGVDSLDVSSADGTVMSNYGDRNRGRVIGVELAGDTALLADFARVSAQITAGRCDVAESGRDDDFYLVKAAISKVDLWRNSQVECLVSAGVNASRVGFG